MQSVVDLLKSHRSIRKFANSPVTEKQLEHIIRCAQATATSSNLQAYTVISVNSEEHKKALAACSGNQKHVETAPVFLVWCADIRRLMLAGSLHKAEFQIPKNTELFLVASIDTALAAQNAVVAAESMGLGTVYIGGIRNEPRKVCQILQIPSGVFPLFGMCIGVPDGKLPAIKPRLPMEAVWHRDRYPADEEQIPHIQQYDDVMKEYYATRDGGNRDSTWSLDIYSKLRRPDIRAQLHYYLHEQGFELK